MQQIPDPISKQVPSISFERLGVEVEDSNVQKDEGRIVGFSLLRRNLRAIRNKARRCHGRSPSRTDRVSSVFPTNDTKVSFQEWLPQEKMKHVLHILMVEPNQRNQHSIKAAPSPWKRMLQPKNPRWHSPMTSLVTQLRFCFARKEGEDFINLPSHCSHRIIEWFVKQGQTGQAS